LEKQQTSGTALGRCEQGGREAGSADRKRAWFYYALARLAVTRNLSLAAAIAAICVGAVGLTLWAVGVKQRAAARALIPIWNMQPAAEQAITGQDPLFQFYDLGPDGPTLYMVDPNEHPELYVPVTYTYKCGHSGSFIPAESQSSAYDPAGYKAELEQQLCAACQAQADYRAKKAQQQNTDGRK
jgi:hypothetical protein